MRIRLRDVASGLTAIMLVGACSHAAIKTPPTTVRSTTTTRATTTTAAPTPTSVAPLTGLPEADPAMLDRPALVVKIDNADPAARPQSGLNQADVVYEERVEGNVTRLAAVFQSHDANPVGPIRSARTTDVPIIGPLNHPLYAWSGANVAFAKIIRSSPLVDVGAEAAGPAYLRLGIGGHRAPHNLYSSTQALYTHTPAGAIPPPPLFVYRKPGEAPGFTAKPVASVNVNFGVTGAPADWLWDASKGVFLRAQRGTPHVDAAGVQIGPANVIVQFANYRDTGYVDVSGAPVPEAVLVGTGTCWVLTGGKMIEGTWSKPSNEAVTTFVDSTGKPIALTPGSTWVELTPPGGAAATG